MLTMLTPPDLEEFLALWGEPLPNRTAVPDLAQTGDRLQRGAALSPQYHNEHL